MTDHGEFVVFNVYIPYSNGMNESFQNKLRFLNALEVAVRHQKVERSKKIIIAGDFNICSTQDDAHWSYRSLNIGLIMNEVREKTLNPEEKGAPDYIPKWKIDIFENWNRITEVLQSIEAISVKTKNPTTGETFEKYRAHVSFKDGRKKVFIGSNESCANVALCHYNFKKTSAGDSEVYHCVPLQSLVELMGKIGDIVWDDMTIKEISHYRGPATELPSPTTSWLRRLMEEADLIDSFRYLYPNAKHR